MKARYRCLKCSHEWTDDPGMVRCPSCRYVYVKWVNYEEWRKER